MPQTNETGHGEVAKVHDQHEGLGQLVDQLEDPYDGVVVLGKLSESFEISLCLGQSVTDSGQVEDSKVDGGQVENVGRSTDQGDIGDRRQVHQGVDCITEVAVLEVDEDQTGKIN